MMTAIFLVRDGALVGQVTLDRLAVCGRRLDALRAEASADCSYFFDGGAWVFGNGEESEDVPTEHVPAAVLAAAA